MFFSTSKPVLYGVLSVIVGMPSLITAADEVSFTTTDWAPYYGAHLKDNGFYADITRAAMGASGHKAKLAFEPWARSLARVKNGKAHVLMGAYYSDERKEFCEFSDVVATAGSAILVRSDSSLKFTGIDSLRGLNIGIERGALTGNKEFDEGKDFNKQPVAKREINLRKLKAGRIDAIADGEKVLLAMISKMSEFNLNDFKVLSPPLSTNNLYNCFSKKTPNHLKLTADFNSGLKKIKSSGTYDKILKKHGFK